MHRTVDQRLTFNRRPRATADSGAAGLVKARLRQVSAARWGMRWSRDPRTGAWEVTAVGPQLRRLFAKRAEVVADQLRRDQLDPASGSSEQAKTAAAKTREAKQPPGGAKIPMHRYLGVTPATLVA